MNDEKVDQMIAVMSEFIDKLVFTINEAVMRASKFYDDLGKVIRAEQKRKRAKRHYKMSHGKHIQRAKRARKGRRQ